MITALLEYEAARLGLTTLETSQVKSNQVAFIFTSVSRTSVTNMNKHDE